MNSLLVTYEKHLIQSYGDDANRSKTVMVGTTVMHNLEPDTDNQYMVFEASQNLDIRNEMDSLPHKMQNPFTDMRRWLKFEILDLQAILEAIDKKNEMEKRRNKKITDRRDAIKQIKDMKEGKDTLRTYFMSQTGKVNKITELTDSVIKAESDIECLGLLHKIVVIQLN
jgi:hypothetical protein